MLTSPCALIPVIPDLFLIGPNLLLKYPLRVRVGKQFKQRFFFPLLQQSTRTFICSPFPLPSATKQECPACRVWSFLQEALYILHICERFIFHPEGLEKSWDAVAESFLMFLDLLNVRGFITNGERDCPVILKHSWRENHQCLNDLQLERYLLKRFFLVPGSSIWVCPASSWWYFSDIPISGGDCYWNPHKLCWFHQVILTPIKIEQ